MARQTVQGKGFEYACLLYLHEDLIANQEILIEDSPTLRQARKAYESLQDIVRFEMYFGARAAIQALYKLEPQLKNPGGNTPLILKIQRDSSGAEGDVRDILAIRQQNSWEIGISVKHNHAAVKHSRLSRTIDFGNIWLGIPCSNNYFREITPVFQELDQLREHGIKWRDLDNKLERFYVPILEAFMNELRALNRLHGEIIPQELLKYLLGRNDFYKIITDTQRRVTKLQTFSFNGTLNKAAGRVKPLYRVPQLQLPTIIHSIDFKPRSKTTINIVCNEGWQLSARIHSASTYVEPSLKFDINLIGLPPSVHSHDEPWGLYEEVDESYSSMLVAEKKRQ